MTGFENLKCNNPLVLIGCGHMGGALLRGWLAGGLEPDVVWVVDPDPSGEVIKSLPSSHLVKITEDVHSGPPRMIVLAVKPQVMSEILPRLSDLAGPDTAVLSIAAGTTLATIEAAMDQGDRESKRAKVIRAIPNMPAAIGFGISGMVAGRGASSEDQALAHSLLSAVGAVVTLDDEKLIDAVTALSGSGPAYVFYLVEALATAGEDVGLDRERALNLSRQTIIGAGRLLEASSESAAQLRQNVTSPKGTTQAALEVLMEGDALQNLMKKAVRCAYERARELGKED